MQLAEIYDRNAAYWDSKLYRAVYYRGYVRLFRALPHDGGLRRPLRVLDCGVGAGLLSEALLNAAGRQIELNGIDLSSKLLAMSKEKFNRQSVQARLAFGDVCRLPYRDEQMDLVISGLVLEHVLQPADAVREMARVLSPGGPLVIVATRRGAPDWYFRKKYHYKPYLAAAVIDWMNTAGLAGVRSRPLSGIARLFAQAYTGRKLGSSRSDFPGTYTIAGDSRFHSRRARRRGDSGLSVLRSGETMSVRSVDAQCAAATSSRWLTVRGSEPAYSHFSFPNAVAPRAPAGCAMQKCARQNITNASHNQRGSSDCANTE